jgi:hypothetical protein
MELSQIESRHWRMAVALALLTIALGAWQMVPGVTGIYHDDGIYVCTAKALAQGQGYRLINLPDSPLQTKYPIIYPALLAMVWKIWPVFPDNLVLMQWLTLLAGAAAVGLSYLFLIRFGYFSAGIASAAGLLASTSPQYLYFSVITMSETTFLLLLVLSMWLLEGELGASRQRPLREIILGIFLTLPFLCRSVGIMFIPISFFLLYRAGRSLRYVISATALTCIPWILWTAIVPRWEGNMVAIDYTNYLKWWSDLGIIALGRIILLNSLYILTSVGTLDQTILTELQRIISFYSWIVFLPLGFVAFYGIGKQLRQFRVLPGFLVGYFLVVVVWPWPPARFITPVLPFLLAYILHELWQSIPERSYLVWKRILLAVLGVFLMVNLTFPFLFMGVCRSNCYPYSWNLKQPVQWSSYVKTFAWIKTHTKTSDVIASGLDSMIYLYTGRAAFRPYMVRPVSLFYGEDSPPLGELKDFYKIMRWYKPRYLVQTAMPGFSEEKPLNQLIEQVRTKNPQWLKPVYTGEDSRFIIFELQPAHEPVPLE